MPSTPRPSHRKADTGWPRCPLLLKGRVERLVNSYRQLPCLFAEGLRTPRTGASNDRTGTGRCKKENRPPVSGGRSVNLGKRGEPRTDPGTAARSRGSGRTESGRARPTTGRRGPARKGLDRQSSPCPPPWSSSSSSSSASSIGTRTIPWPVIRSSASHTELAASVRRSVQAAQQRSPLVTSPW